MCKFGLEITSVSSGTTCPESLAQYDRNIQVEVSGSRTKSITDITDGLAFGKLAKQHRYKMCPAVISFLVFVCLFFLNQFVENITVQF